MDFFQIINDIAKADPELLDRLDSRRQVFRNCMHYGQKITTAALPLALSSLFSKAYGQTTGGSGFDAAINATLNLALQLEYLEFYFYQTALNSSPGLLNTEQRRAIEIILNDEALHIKSLRGLLKNDAIADPGRAAFDYTGSQGGRRPALAPFNTLGATFGDFGQFITASQGFVDTGVRAYKGGAPNLMSNKDVLEAALNIHSVEARHSSRIRSLKRGGIQNVTPPKSWITPDEVGTPAPLPNNGVPGTPATVGPYDAGSNATTYPAENNMMQGKDATTMQPINVQTAATGISATAGAESFDEPLDSATVKAIAKNFASNPAALFN
jgi:hypothetical protein